MCLQGIPDPIVQGLVTRESDVSQSDSGRVKAGSRGVPRG